MKKFSIQVGSALELFQEGADECIRIRLDRISGKAVSLAVSTEDQPILVGIDDPDPEAKLIPLKQVLPDDNFGFED